MTNLTQTEIEFLESKGFIRQNDKHSGYYFKENEDGSETIAVIPLTENSYKLEVYTDCIESDGSYYQDFSKIFSLPTETFTQFILKHINN